MPRCMLCAILPYTLKKKKKTVVAEICLLKMAELAREVGLPKPFEAQEITMSSRCQTLTGTGREKGLVRKSSVS